MRHGRRGEEAALNPVVGIAGGSILLAAGALLLVIALGPRGPHWKTGALGLCLATAGSWLLATGLS